MLDFFHIAMLLMAISFLFLIKENQVCGRLPLAYNIVADNMHAFVLEVNLTCAKILLACNIVILMYLC